MSIGPRRSRHSATKARREAAFITSPWIATAVPPRASIVATVSRSVPGSFGGWLSRLRATAATRAPSEARRSAIAAPMPRLAPVTSATRSLHSPAMGASFFRGPTIHPRGVARRRGSSGSSRSVPARAAVALERGAEEPSVLADARELERLVAADLVRQLGDPDGLVEVLGPQPREELPDRHAVFAGQLALEPPHLGPAEGIDARSPQPLALRQQADERGGPGS